MYICKLVHGVLRSLYSIHIFAAQMVDCNTQITYLLFVFVYVAGGNLFLPVKVRAV